MSFTAGAGEWVGDAAVFDATGRLAGFGVDTRTVTPQGDGTTVVDVAFDGPFSFAGRYTIAADGRGRRYLGPLNLGGAEQVTDHVVESHNHWPDLGLSQRFLLAVDPGGGTQLSLAVLARGAVPVWYVVGEHRRPGAPPSPGPATDPLLSPGRWRGELPSGPYAEDVGPEGARLAGTPAGDAELAWERDGTDLWTTGRDPATLHGSATVVGDRALLGTFTLPAAGLRLERREVASGDGRRKAVLHRWYRGAGPVAVVAGVVERDGAGRDG